MQSLLTFIDHHIALVRKNACLFEFIGNHTRHIDQVYQDYCNEKYEKDEYDYRNDYDSDNEYLYGGFTDDWEDYYDSVYN